MRIGRITFDVVAPAAWRCSPDPRHLIFVSAYSIVVDFGAASR